MSPQKVGKAPSGARPGWEACHLEDFTLLWGNSKSSTPTPQEAWCPVMFLCLSGVPVFPITLSQPWGIGRRNSAWELEPDPHPEGQSTQQSHRLYRHPRGRSFIPGSSPSSHKDAEFSEAEGLNRMRSKAVSAPVGPRHCLWLPDGSHLPIRGFRIQAHGCELGSSGHLLLTGGRSLLAPDIAVAELHRKRDRV